LGYPSRELYFVFDQKSNFYMLGSLGLASSIGLGVALFSSKDVVVLDGDGSLLMNPNALISIGALKPRNLTVICLDNGTYGSTGDQPTLTAQGFNLEKLAVTCGIPNVLITDQPYNISNFSGVGPKFIRLVVKSGNAKVPEIGLTALEIKTRFQEWLRGH
jgi:sulfopyruvate decarboxylase subunit beta